MAYEIINLLEKNNETTLLEQLAGSVEATRKENKKLHEVWEISFDWKDCRSNEFVWQKLNYVPARHRHSGGYNNRLANRVQDILPWTPSP